MDSTAQQIQALIENIEELTRHNLELRKIVEA